MAHPSLPVCAVMSRHVTHISQIESQDFEAYNVLHECIYVYIFILIYVYIYKMCIYVYNKKIMYNRYIYNIYVYMRIYICI